MYIEISSCILKKRGKNRKKEKQRKKEKRKKKQKASTPNAVPMLVCRGPSF